MNERIERLGRSNLGPLWLGVAYYALAALSLGFTSGKDGVATVWPPSGLLLAVLLVAPSPALWKYVAAGAVASFAANLGMGTTVPGAMGLTAANMLEAVIATLLLRRRHICRVSFVDPAGLLRFCSATLLAATASMVVAVASQPETTVAFAISWFSTVWLGMLIGTPLLLTGVELVIAQRRKAAIHYRRSDLIAIIALMAGVSCVTFFQSRYPILFLPEIVMLIAVLRCGGLGAVISLIIVAALGSLALSQGMGPAVLIRASHETRVLFFQFYLLALFCSALPMARLLAGRERLRIDLDERIRLLSQAESSAHIGHWRMVPVGPTMYWSPEVYRIHGLAPDGRRPTRLEALAAYHPDDRPAIAEAVKQALRDGRPFEVTGRIVRPDGSIRHVVTRGERDYTSADQAIGLFGLIQDVTDQREAERVLQEARDAAIRSERRALVLAETDMLTGLPNRRKIAAELQDAVAAAIRDGQPLSVAIFDIDHFKSVNDRFGHATGDEVLRRVARAAAATLRATDMIGRFGGEEFVMILPGTDADMAMRVASRVCTAVALSAEGTALPPVTVSLGLAAHGAEIEGEAFLARADAALYGAKNGGRNQYRLAA